MASGPIISWEVDGQTVAEFIFLGSKITADGDCTHSVDMSSSKLREMVKYRGAWRAAFHGVSTSRT